MEILGAVAHCQMLLAHRRKIELGDRLDTYFEEGTGGRLSISDIQQLEAEGF